MGGGIERAVVNAASIGLPCHTCTTSRAQAALLTHAQPLSAFMLGHQQPKPQHSTLHQGHHPARGTEASRLAGARAFALDTRSKRQWESKPLAAENAESFVGACATFGFDPAHIVPHGSYLINLGSSNPELAAKSYTAFLDGMPLV